MLERLWQWIAAEPELVLRSALIVFVANIIYGRIQHALDARARQRRAASAIRTEIEATTRVLRDFMPKYSQMIEDIREQEEARVFVVANHQSSVFFDSVRAETIGFPSHLLSQLVEFYNIDNECNAVLDRLSEDAFYERPLPKRIEILELSVSLFAGAYESGIRARAALSTYIQRKGSLFSLDPYRFRWRYVCYCLRRRLRQ